MFRICALIFAAFVLAVAEEQAPASLLSNAEGLDVKVIPVDNIERYRAEHPEAVITPLKAEQTRASVRYTLGSRTSGDKLVATGSNSYTWPVAQSVQLTLRYPTTGTGSIVTYVEVLCLQSNTAGRGYVVSGGIGQRYISVVVEATSTTYLQYTAGIYGI